MKERTSADITICGTDGNAIAKVPITSSSKRVVHLMQSDYIQLDFTLSEAKEFPIGSYVDDDIFGRFYVTEEQMPKYDTSTAGYKYELKLNAWYYLWQLKQFMLVTTLGTTDTEYTRKEITWNLTNSLKEQMRQFMLNLLVIGCFDNLETKPDFLNSDTDLDKYVSIDEKTVDNAPEALTMSYSGTYMIDALNELADKWECEYWVTGTESDFVIHFGKCCVGDDREVLSLNDNVESMELNNDTSSSADVIYAFGSTDNIPYSYRKVLELQVDKKIGSSLTQKTLLMPNRKLTWDMFLSEAEIEGSHHEASITDQKNSVIVDTNVTADWMDELLDSTTKSMCYGAYKLGDFTLDSATGSKIGIALSGKLYSNKDTWWNKFKDASGAIFSEYFKIAVKVGIYIVSDDNYSTEDAALSQFYNVGSLGSGVAYIEYSKNNQFDQEGIGGDTYVEKFNNALFYNWNGTSDTKRQDVENGKYNIFLCYAFALDEDVSGFSLDGVLLKDFITANFGFQLTASYTFDAIQDANHAIPITYGDKFQNEAFIILNPNGAEIETKYWYNQEYYSFAICDNEGVVDTEATEEWAENIGRKFRINTDVSVSVPMAYYTSEYDNETSLAQLGESRLLLPTSLPSDVTMPSGWNFSPKGYIYRDGFVVDDKIVKYARELSVAFDKVYPDGKLFIRAILSSTEKKKYDFDDGSENTVTWQQYHLQLVSATDYKTLADLPATDMLAFDKGYILDGKELGIRFLVPNDVKDIVSADDYTTLQSQCKMAGMQFSAEFNKNYTSGNVGIDHFKEYDYAIVRNSDFGALLPNDILKPNVGDPCCLLNWNVKAISELGLIDKAEKKLLLRAIEYAQALQDGNFTFTCNMMSDFMFYSYDEQDVLVETANNIILTNADEAITVIDKKNFYTIPQIGQNVTIKHPALKNGYKNTRVIGIEMKIDKPYDSPKLTCGETDAYSRIKQLEKEITKLSK